jgi:SAM-dependent methyltransferase
MDDALRDPPAPLALGAEVQRIYRNRFSEADREVKDRVWRVIVGDYLQRYFAPEDVVLDVGCGYGEFLNHVKCARRIGIDLNPDSKEALAEGIEFHSGDVRDLSFLADASVDAVFTSNLLEHLPDKREVDRLLGEIRRVLKRGGQLVALGPNLRFLPGEYWDFWDHHTGITDRSLVEALANLGYEVTHCVPRFLPYTTRSALPRADFLVRLYLRLPLVWRLLGKQFLVCARKP